MRTIPAKTGNGTPRALFTFIIINIARCLKIYQILPILSRVLLFLWGAQCYYNPLMEQHTVKNVNNYLNTSIYSYLETSGSQSSNLYLNVIHFFNTRVN